MNLSALFRRKGPVNLLPKDSFEESILGKILSWALVFGKWTVIVTQLIVIVAFILRFGLDRRLTDLRQSIEVENSRVNSFSQLEGEFRLAQARLDVASEVIDRQDTVNELITHLSAITPQDVWYERMTLAEDTVSITAYSGSIGGFSSFIQGVKSDPRFSSVNVGSVSGGSKQGARLQFEITLNFGEGDK